MSAQKSIYGKKVDLGIDDEENEVVFEAKGEEKTTFIDKI